MRKEYYRIKDRCRKGLLPYLAKAFTHVPQAGYPEILDIGCGTGVPTLWLAENRGESITAIDSDRHAIEWLQEKITAGNLADRVTALNIPFFDFRPGHGIYDLILAEGFLNVVGFRQGFEQATAMLRNGGYFVIHDEYSDHGGKCDLIRDHRCKVIDTVFLDEKTWWNDYYKQLETEVNASETKGIRDLFRSDIREIGNYKKDPTQFRSIYYIVLKL